MGNGKEAAALERLHEELQICEAQVWDALVAGDGESDAACLHPDFLGVYPSGFAGRADHVGQLDHGPTVARYELSEHRVLPLGEDHAVLSYRADFQRVGRQAVEVMYVSSIWRNGPDGWINLFSQDTPV